MRIVAFIVGIIVAAIGGVIAYRALFLDPPFRGADHEYRSTRAAKHTSSCRWHGSIGNRSGHSLPGPTPAKQVIRPSLDLIPNARLF